MNCNNNLFFRPEIDLKNDEDSAILNIKNCWNLAEYCNHNLFYRTEIDPENAEHYQYAANFVETLIKELENKAASMETEELFLTRIKLQEAAEYFKVISFY